jgi:hypothetical protein
LQAQMIVDRKLRFWCERNQLFFIFEFPLNFRAVFGGELRTDKAVLLQIINIFQRTVLRQIIGRGDQYHFERRRNRYGNHLFRYLVT